MIIGVIGAAGLDSVDQLDAADFHQPVAAAEAEPRRLGVEHDFAHAGVIGLRAA